MQPADLSPEAAAAVAIMRTMLVATTAAVRSSLSEDELERRRALLEATPPSARA